MKKSLGAFLLLTIALGLALAGPLTAAPLVRPKLKPLAQAIVDVGSSRVDLQACKLEYSIVSPK